MFLFLVPIFLPWFLCLCLSVLSSLWCCKSSNIHRTKNFIDFFKRLSWTLTISTCYLGMVLLSHIRPHLTHIRLPERKVKKYIRPLLLNALSCWVIKLIHPCYKWSNPKERRLFQTSKVEQAQRTMIVIIHILLII